MKNVSTFVDYFYREIKKEKNFLAFIVTGNKPILSEVLLSQLINKQLNEKINQVSKIDILEQIQDSKQKKLFFKINKKRSNSKFLYYDLCIYIGKKENGLYIFENKSSNIKEEISKKSLETITYLKSEDKLIEKIIKENNFPKVPNTKLVLQIISIFGLDWIYKDNFFQKIDYFSTVKAFSDAKQELAKKDSGFNLLLSEYFVSFLSARSNDRNINKIKNIKFYANSESFLNFFDENLESFHLVKLNIGELKFNEAIHRFDSLCMEKNLSIDNNFLDFDFAIQSGSLIL